MINPMIDWVSCVIPLRHFPIETGRMIKVTPEGEPVFDVPLSQRFEGSYESSIVLKSQGDIDTQGRASELFFDGNPSKYLQGHNVFGSNNLKELLHGCFRLLHNFGLFDFNLFDAFCAVDSAKVVKIDITSSIRFDNRNQVRAYIKQLSQFAHTRNGRPQQKGWSLAFNPNSRRWMLKAYSKGDEFIKNKPSKHFQHTDYLQSEADRLCRVELAIRSLELSDLNLNQVYKLTPSVVNGLYDDYVRRIIMSETIELTSEVLTGLPKCIRHTYLAWKSGIGVQAEMSETQYYRHRSELMKVGVDISVPYEASGTADIVPLKTVVQAEPYQIPQEAIDKGLLFKYEQPKLSIVN